MTLTEASRAELLVVGAGPGGYTAAIRAAQLGARVALVEREEVGGVCVNRGCVPTKALLNTATILDSIRRREGVLRGFEGLHVGFSAVMACKDEVVAKLVSGIRALLRANDVRLIEGTARFMGVGTVQVSSKDGGTTTVEAEKSIIATGSSPAAPPISGLEASGSYTSDNALELRDAPQSLLVVGGGPVGLELAQIYRGLGSQVTVVEMMPHILPLEDGEVAEQLSRLMVRQEIAVITNARAESVQGAGDGEKTVAVATTEGPKQLRASHVLLAVGRRPNTEDLGLETLGARIVKGRVEVDDRCRTSVTGLYAIGDVAGGAFAHTASAQGVVAAENALGGDSRFDARTTPRCIFTIPQVACVGLTGEQAEAGGYQVQVGRFPFLANSAAQAALSPEGFVKIVADSRTGEVLGVHILGAHATEVIPTATLAMRLEATVEDLADLTFPHPTFGEALKEAALDAGGRAIHVARRRAPLRV